MSSFLSLRYHHNNPISFPFLFLALFSYSSIFLISSTNPSHFYHSPSYFFLFTCSLFSYLPLFFFFLLFWYSLFSTTFLFYFCFYHLKSFLLIPYFLTSSNSVFYSKIFSIVKFVMNIKKRKV